MPLVTMPDGTDVEMPDDISPEQGKRLRAVLQAQAKPKEKEDGVVGNALGNAEAVLATASAPVAALAGNVAGLAKTLTGGKYGTPEGIQQGIEAGNKVADALTYEPRTKTGREMVEKIGKLFDDSKLAGLPPVIGNEVPVRKLAGPSTRQLGADVERSFEQAPKPVGMPGVGAAETDVARMRRERAASLPVPVQLSKGQATRDFEQQRFERETAKDGKMGQPLREHFAQNNEQILANFDAWFDQTGANAPDLYRTGQAVDDALVTRAKRAKAQVNAAYTKARESGQMQAKVPTDDLVGWVEQNRSKMRNAPVIATIEDELLRLKGAEKGQDGLLKPGSISINDMEELRKTVNDVMGQDPTNRLFGGKAKGVIDQTTEGRGGDLYKEARAKRLQYGKEFEDRGIVAKLLKTKPGTEDRSVALENVFNHSVLASSQDDLRFLQDMLTKEGGAKGEQAWREVQGQAVQYLKQQATKNSARDVKGNPIVSAAALDRAVMDLDRKGKLDILFGKQGAQALRDINDLAKDVYTAPPGSVNPSGTTSTLLEAMSHVPVIGKYPAIARALTMAKKKLQDRQTKKRVTQSLEQPE